ncbi:MAG TPA: xanthine dehydrogenase family protein subunit M [Edaphobacter sp.]|nr:xanthine dehydrogenase family protein subunit M [Edaphobacter sp.]
MNPFQYQRASAPEEAIHAVAATRGAKFLGGGTNLVDLMKYDVEHPSALVDINHLSFNQVTTTSDGGAMIGAGVRNSDLANHEIVRRSYPLLSQALLSGASPQLRNMATTGGNLLQRTRCYYFNDTSYAECNKRSPGSGCAAVKGFHRIHAILGATDACIATNPSDMNVALAALDATIHVQGPKGKRAIAIHDFHLLPGNTPHIETTLRPDELITAVELPPSKFAGHSYYLKVRDRQSYSFALVSVAAALELDGSTIRSGALALGGVAHKPWRSPEAEHILAGAPATEATFRRAAEAALTTAVPRQHNAFKVELAKISIVRALTTAAKGVQA